MSNKCENCAAWSQLMAEARGGRVFALCLNPSSPKEGKWTAEHDKCAAWSDDPALSDLT